MAAEEADAKAKPLAVLKVLYRNSSRLKEAGKDHADTLKPVAAEALTKTPTGEQLRDQVRKNDLPGAERTFAAICASGPADAALDQLMVMVDDATEVHRVVLVSRAYELLDFVGPDSGAHAAAAVGPLLREGREARRPSNTRRSATSCRRCSTSTNC